MAKLIDNTSKPNKPAPSVSLSEDDMPEIKGWKVGQKYSIILEVELTRLSKGDIFLDEQDRKWDASFKILNASTDGKEREQEEEEKTSRYPEAKMKMQVMKEKMKKMDEEEPEED